MVLSHVVGRWVKGPADELEWSLTSEKRGPVSTASSRKTGPKWVCKGLVYLSTMSDRSTPGVANAFPRLLKSPNLDQAHYHTQYLSLHPQLLFRPGRRPRPPWIVHLADPYIGGSFPLKCRQAVQTALEPGCRPRVRPGH